MRKDEVLENRIDIPGLDSRLIMRTHGRADSCVSKQIQQNRIWEPYETSLVLDHLKAGHVFLDIGANIGYYTIIASAIVRDAGLVIACEPDETNCRLLFENLALNHADNVIVFQAAVSDYNGQGQLYLSPENKGDHRLFDCDGGRLSRKIKVISGKHLASVTERIDFIKIDTQGAEYHILKGIKDIVFKNRRHLIMIVEFWPYGLRMAGTSGNRMLDVLASFKMPLNIIDHLSHQLWPVDIEALRSWVDEVDRDVNNQGFINLWVTPCREE